jgi:signal transduction histidine kinase
MIRDKIEAPSPQGTSGGPPNEEEEDSESPKGSVPPERSTVPGVAGSGHMAPVSSGRGPNLGIRRRIMLYVTAGLVLMFGVLIFAGLRALDQATDLVFEARLSTAKSLALTLERDLVHVTADVHGFVSDLVRAPEGPALDRLVSSMMRHLASDSFTFFESDGIEVVASDGRRLTAAGSPFGFELPDSDDLKGGDSEARILGASGDPSEDPGFATMAIHVESISDQSWVLVHLSALNSPRPLVLEDYMQNRGSSEDSVPSGTDDSYHLEVIDPAGNVALGIGGDERPGLPSPHMAALVERSPMVEPVVLRHLADPGSEAGEHVMGVVPLPDFGLTLILEQPIDVALALPLRLRRQLLLWSAVSFAGSLIVAWATTRAVVRPTQQLTLAAERIAGGDLDSPIEVTARDEFKVLADRFESMRQGIKKAYDAVEVANQVLETRVKERTARLGTLLAGIISAQEEERVRLARELHDGTAQTLGALSIALGRAADTVPVESGVSFDQLRKAQEIVGLLLEETRRLILDLRPMLLDDMGLIPAIRWHTESRLAATGIEASFEVDAPRHRFPPHVETALFRIVQEAINNVAKHSEASRLRFSFFHAGDVIRIVVSDDGKGFDMDASGAGLVDGHVGLAGMRERVSLLGGKMSVVSKPGMGTTVRAEIRLIDSGR